MPRWVPRLLFDVAGSLVDLVYPPVCPGCGRLDSHHRPLCESCTSGLTVDLYPACRRCGATIGPHTSAERCPACAPEHFAFDGVFRLGIYGDLRRELVLRAKSDEGLAERIGATFADCMAPRLRNIAVDCVIPVPLHWRRRWQRGYNQCDVYAQALADVLRVPYLRRGMHRTRATLPQSTLSATARRENVRGAFASRARSLTGRTALVVDDVFTTGATADAVARALRAAGASRVLVAVVAHG